MRRRIGAGAVPARVFAGLRRMTRLSLILMLLALTFPAGPVSAQGIDFTQGGPIQITSQDGIEWRQAEQMVIAKGDARAVRGNVTITADRLIAWYRRKGDTAAPQQAAAGAAPQSSGLPDASGPGAAQPAGTGVNGTADTEGNEVFRMRAEGNVHIVTPTDQAWGDQATYDLDEAVLVMTGHALKLTTPSDTLTARDTLEYWSQKHLAVARGDAVVVTNDARRISADTIAAYTVEAAPAGAAAPGQSAAGASANAGPGASTKTGPPDQMADMAGRLQRAEAFNNVSIRTLTDTVTGDRGVYVPDTGIAHLGGHVRITRGMNQVNGSEAIVNMKTGIATLLAGDSGRVSGLVQPNAQTSATAGPLPGGSASSKAPAAQKKPGVTQ
jgi:lipopolysaccharide export system protein LptA